MIHVKTSKGFEMDFDERVLDDAELVDDVAEVYDGNVLRLPSVARKLLGDKKADLYDMIRDKKGIVRQTELMNQLTEIINQVGGKKS